MEEVLTRKRTIFDRAAEVFEGWKDPETGARVLCISRRGEDPEGTIWQTPYHQSRCFYDGGWKVLLHAHGPKGRRHSYRKILLDLVTGKAEDPFPPEWSVVEVVDHARTALVLKRYEKYGQGSTVAVWNMQENRPIAEMNTGDCKLGGCILLSDGRRALVALYQGKFYSEPVRSRMVLLEPGKEPRVLFETENYHCNHMQGCPVDPDLFAYDRWPSPQRDVDQVIHVATLDGRIHEPVKLSPEALRPAQMWGVRDHYVWTPDGRFIVSYLFTHPISIGPDFNHFTFEWYLSVIDWRTGEDLAAKYPPGRWGGHMQVTPDSRFILCCGGPGFDKLFAVNIEELRSGWNEHVICSYPATLSKGVNSDPFPFPFALPDGSGVLFNAGWPGPEHGVYLAEWPESFKANGLTG